MKVLLAKWSKPDHFLRIQHTLWFGHSLRNITESKHQRETISVLDKKINIV